jgi:hypothetical protein
MEDFIFTKEDYGRFCESKESLVQHWSYKQLIKFYPDSEITYKYTKKFMQTKMIKKIERLKYTIITYLRENWKQVDSDFLFGLVEGKTEISFEMQAHILKALAKKERRKNEIVNLLLQIDGRQTNVNTFLVVIEALEILQTDEAYAMLRYFDNDFSSQFPHLETYMGALISYKEEKDIKLILETLIKKPERFDQEDVIASFNRLFKAEEFSYLFRNFFNQQPLEESLETLKHYYPQNRGVKQLDSFLGEELCNLHSNNQYFEFIYQLSEKIMTELNQRYSFEEKLEFDNFSLEFIKQEKEKMREEDYWLLYLLNFILDNKKSIQQHFSVSFFSLELVVMLLVVLEDNDYQKMLKQAKEDQDYLWQQMTLDREELPVELVELFLQSGDIFEDRVIKFLKKNRYAASITRMLDYLVEINSVKSVPTIINLVDEKQGDIICEDAVKALEKIDGYQLETISRGMEASDSTTHIFISSALEQFASDQAAEKTIEYWENGILDFHEMFVCTLQEIGSKLGYDYLSEVEDRSAPDYLWETLIILGTVHGEKPAKLKEYKKILQEKNDAKSSQDPFEAFVQKYETKTGESSADMDNDEEYTRNSDGTIIRTEEKVGRNDPCPCGSGKKYKKCCGR